MTAASTYLPSATSSTIAASSIHGTGVQNLLKADRNGCTAVSGIALGPNFLRQVAASSFVRPLREPSVALPADLSGEAGAAGGTAPGLGSAGEGKLKDDSHQRSIFSYLSAETVALFTGCQVASGSYDTISPAIWSVLGPRSF